MLIDSAVSHISRSLHPRHAVHGGVFFKFEYRDPKDFCIKTACYLSRHSVHLFQAHYVQLLLHFMLSCYLNYSDVCLDEVEFQLRNQLKLFFFFCPMSMYTLYSIGGPVTLLLGCLQFTITVTVYFNTLMVTHPSANPCPSCLTIQFFS